MARRPRAHIAAANGQEPALDLTVKRDAAALGGQARRPRAADRLGAHHRARHGDGAAGLRRRRVVGAGRRGSAAGAAARRCRGAARRRSVRRARRQDGAACRCRRSRHRGRSCAGAAQAAAGKSHAAVARRPSWSAPTSTGCGPAGQPFDAVLLDAPCSSTGTIRRHPDVPWLKRAADIAALAGLQRRLLDRAVALTKPGGTWSTAPVRSSRRKAWTSSPICSRATTACAACRSLRSEVFGITAFISADGDLRTLPCHCPDA